MADTQNSDDKAPRGQVDRVVMPQPRHYVVLVKGFCSVLVMDAESEDKAYEYALDAMNSGDYEMDEAEIERVIDPSDEKEVERTRRFSNVVAEA